MRKWNAVISMAALVLLLLHGVLGGFQMLGAENTAVRGLAWVALGLIVLHTILGVKFTWESVRAWRKTGVSYFRENRLFWARRLSGFAILILLFFHVNAFGTYTQGAYRLQWFSQVKLAVQLLLVAAVAVHVTTNLKPLMLSLGVQGGRKYLGDILFVLSVLLLFMTAAFVLYYLRWNLF